MSVPDRERTIRTLKIAAYVDRLLTAAETHLPTQSWWTKDVEDLLSAVRSASIDQIGSAFGTWAGQKWLDTGENLAARQWLTDSYPEYGATYMYQISELILNYCPAASTGYLLLRIPASGHLLIRDNTQLLQFQAHEAGAPLWWAASRDNESISFRDESGRELDPELVAVPLVAVGRNGTTAIPVLDETSGLVKAADPLLYRRVAAYASRLPPSLLELVGDGRAALAVSDAIPAAGDTRPRLSICPGDLDGDDYTSLERQLLTWLGSEYVRLIWPARIQPDLARMAIQHAWWELGAFGVRSDRMRSDERRSTAADAIPNPHRASFHEAVKRSLSHIAEVVRLLPLPEQVLRMLEPVDPRAVVKTRDNEVVQVNWYLVDRVAALDPLRRQQIIAALSSTDASEGEIFVMAACKYADGAFAEALKYARLCFQIDDTCMEYRFLVAFCLRHMGKPLLFEAEVFPGTAGSS